MQPLTVQSKFHRIHLKKAVCHSFCLFQLKNKNKNKNKKKKKKKQKKKQQQQTLYIIVAQKRGLKRVKL